MAKLSTMPTEDGAAKFTADDFADESGAVVTPKTAKWSLTTMDGTVINGRKDVTLEPASSISWLISGDDLAIDNNGSDRLITVVFTYDSTLGNGIPLILQDSFSIREIVKVK